MITVTKEIGLYKNGDQICVEVTKIQNNSDEAISNVEVAVNVPAGLEYSQGSFPQGAYDTINDKWLVGTLAAGADLIATFCFTITDQTKGDYTITFTISAPEACAECDSSRQFCVVLTGTSCSDFLECGSLDYSTTEQDTGTKDIDGKSIYQRTWVFAGAGDDTYHELTGLVPDNITRIVDSSMSSVITSSGLPAQAIIYQAGATTADPLKIYLNSAEQDFYLTVWYTKA